MYKGKINAALNKFLENKVKEDGAYSEETKKLIENIMEFNLRGGKRIRPLIIIFAYKCFKEGEESQIVDASIAIELMQAYFLIHDDIMDNADLRRGKKSMHKLYDQKDENFGKSIAILAGNACASYVYEVILKSKFSDSSKLKALEWLRWIDQRVNYGQELDLMPGFENLNENEVMKIYELKTASYTAQGPIFLGAALAQATDKEINQLKEYGHKIGMAFQIQDDILGVYGNIEEIGKPNDSDIKEGKKTLLIVKALELCNAKDREFLLKNYGVKNTSDEDLEKIRSIIKNCKALEYCNNKVEQLVAKGKESISNLELRKEGKDFLFEMAEYIKNMT